MARGEAVPERGKAAPEWTAASDLDDGKAGAWTEETTEAAHDEVFVDGGGAGPHAMDGGDAAI
ncbi:hypothetical protein OsI_07830 [Oryza sativa Indica Group]|nr:hypothetical protein OsI_07830 [Oryza sativa Indica Group]